MRLLTLVLALVALVSVAYVSFTTPSRADVFSAGPGTLSSTAAR